MVYTKRFQKDIKLLQKRGYNLDVLKKAVETLEKDGNLPVLNKPHKLSGNFSGFMEAHLRADWLIIWKIFPEENEVWLTRTGTHSDLF
ncbi:MAG: type II toxin-antitoxin system YafQ family toxin [Bacteroidetes bacterium]|nr:type II toxin-antitoxin system YafQ family toxin [Bacteroidota bacterium]